MANNKFQVKKTDTGYNFLLIAANGQPIGSSQVYKSLKSAIAGTESVRKVAPVAEIEDQTKSEVEEKKNPKFVIYFDKADQFRFKLQSSNGQNILASQGYTTLAACQNGIASVVKNAAESEVELPEDEESEEPKKEEAKPEKKAAPKAEKKAEEKPEPKKEAPKAEEKKPEPKAEEKKPEPKKEAPKAEEKKPEPKKEAPKAEPKKEAPKAEKKAEKAPAEPKYENRLIKRYKEEIVPALVKEFGYTSVMQAPRLEKIVLNIGVGEATSNEKALEDAVKDLETITGQKPVVTKAKKSIATFKLREGQKIGCKVDLRGLRMYEFLDKLVSIALPRVRDFRGISRSAFDGHGNYTLGVKEQIIFPEIDFDKVTIRGLDVVIVTTAKSDKEAESLLEKIGMPFRRN